MARIENHGLGTALSTPIVVYADRLDSAGDVTLLGGLKVDFDHGVVTWFVMLDPYSDSMAHGMAVKGLSSFLSKVEVSGAEAKTLEELRDTYVRLFTSLAQHAQGLAESAKKL